MNVCMNLAVDIILTKSRKTLVEMYSYLDGDDLQELISKQGLSYYFVFVHIYTRSIFQGKNSECLKQHGEG